MKFDYTIERVGKDFKVTLEIKPLLWFMKTKTRAFVGSCTVWHELPDFKRASIMMESTLSDIWSKYQYDHRAQ